MSYRSPIRPRLATVLVMSAAVLGGAQAATAGARAEKEERKVVDASGLDAIIVNNARGRSVVVGREQAGKVIIVATRVAHASSEKKAQARLDDLVFEVEEKDGTLVVRTRNDEHGDSRSIWSVIRGDRTAAYIDYAIEVPRHFNVKVATTSGEARVSGIDGAARMHATSGTVVVREIRGDVSAEVTSGTVEARDVGGSARVIASSGRASVVRLAGALEMKASSGSLEAEQIGGDASVAVASGNVMINGCLGNVTYVTSSGDGAIREVQGSVSAISSSGDIEVMILPVGDKEFNISSSSGNIDVRYLPAMEYGFLLDVNTNSGSIEGDMAIKVDKITRRQLKGIVGTGAARVFIETASGDVRIVEKNGSGANVREESRKRR